VYALDQAECDTGDNQVRAGTPSQRYLRRVHEAQLPAQESPDIEENIEFLRELYFELRM
jgi:hypothetical protein